MAPAWEDLVPLLTVTAVMGSRAMTPDKDIMTVSIRKADNNSFYSLVRRNYFLFLFIFSSEI